jgi:hypothetical protein
MASVAAITAVLKAKAFEYADFADDQVRIADESGDQDAIHCALVRQREAHETVLKYAYLK